MHIYSEIMCIDSNKTFTKKTQHPIKWDLSIKTKSIRGLFAIKIS